jgi:hypothetical protein
MTPLYRRHLDDRQMRQRWLDPRLATVRVRDLRAYLLSKGWEIIPSDQPHELVFREPGVNEAGPLYQWIPDSEMGRDYVQRVYEVIAAIAEVEDRYAGDIVSDIVRQPQEGGSNGVEACLETEAVSK